MEVSNGTYAAPTHAFYDNFPCYFFHTRSGFVHAGANIIELLWTPKAQEAKLKSSNIAVNNNKYKGRNSPLAVFVDGIAAFNASH